MSIVFGSPAAHAIRARDRRLFTEPSPERRESLEQELASVMARIDELTVELMGLEGQAAELRYLLRGGAER